MWSSLTPFCGFQLLVLLPWFIEIIVFICTNRINLLNLKEKLIQASNCCKRVLKAAKLAYAYKTKFSVTYQKLGSQDFWQTANSVLNKVKSAIPPLVNNLEVLSSASDTAKLFPKNFFKNFNLDESCISLPVFTSRTNLKHHKVSVTPKMIEKVIKKLDSSKETS